jgi:hypothetical protein
MMKTMVLTIATALAGCFLLAGCGKSPATVVDAQAKFFQGSPELKTNWDQAVAGFNARDYAGAIRPLMVLKAQNLTPEQLAAVDKAMAVVMETMYTAASKGDAAAKQAIEDLKKLPRR